MALEVMPPRIPVARLREELKSEERSKRLRAVHQLGGAMRDEDVRPAAHALGLALADPSPRVCLEALRGLDRVVWRRPITEEDLSADQADKPTKARQLLEQVLAAARDERLAHRSAALRALGCFHVPEAFAALRRGARDEAAEVRVGAIRGMYRAGSRRFTALLLGRVEDPDPHVQKAAIEALFGESSWSGRSPEYVKATRATVGPLLKILVDPSHPAWPGAAWALAKLDVEQAVPTLIRSVQCPHCARAALNVLHSMNRIHTRAAIDAILAGLKSPHDAVRRECCGAIIFMDRKYDRQFLGPLATALKDPDAAVVRRALRAYARRPDIANENLSALIKLLSHGESAVREEAIRAVRRGCDEDHRQRVIEGLRGMLKDPNYGVRDAAGEALWDLGVQDVDWRPPAAPACAEGGRPRPTPARRGACCPCVCGGRISGCGPGAGDLPEGASLLSR